MANTFNGTTFTNIARKGLSIFSKKLSGLNIFTTDLSGDVIQGNAVSTRIVPAATTPVTQTGSLAYNDASILAGVTTTAVTVTLNQRKVCGFALTDDEVTQISAGVMADTKSRLIEKHVNALANQLQVYVLNLITQASYGAAAVTCQAAAFDYEQVVDLRTALLKADFPLDMTALVLNADYAGALLKDAKIASKSDSGISAITDGAGALVRLNGLSLFEAPALHNASTVVAENLVGFACTPDALAIAMRGLPATQGAVPTEFIEVVTDDQSGATLTAYAWRDSANRQWVFNFEAYYGAIKANAAALKRIVSA
jgi:hypothetical protein